MNFKFKLGSASVKKEKMRGLLGRGRAVRKIRLICPFVPENYYIFQFNP